MLRQLKLKNFRQHEDKSIVFGPGLTAIKGANESGKSTVIEAVLYALFGAAALRDPLADTVTWDHKESELKVELTIEVEGRLFNFKRSKSGAECEHEGGLVTGQKEVSGFAAEILGADMTTVTRLMMANQNSLRGALEDGPKAVAQQIEVLADFDLFDRIIDAANTKLTLGSPAMFEERVRACDSAVAEAAPLPPDTAAIDAEAANCATQVATLSVGAETLVLQQSEIDGKVQSAENTKRMHDMLTGNVVKALDTRNLHLVQKQEADAKAAAPWGAQADIERLKTDIANVESFAARAKIHGQFFDITGTYPEAFWEGTKESFEAEVEGLESRVAAATAVLAEEQAKASALDRKSRELRSQVITSTTCSSCGQDLKDKSQIESRNKATKAAFAQVDADHVEACRVIAGMEKAIGEQRAELRELKAVAKTATPFERFATQYGEHLVVSFDFYPPKLSWKGEEPEGAILNVEELRQRLVSLEDAKNGAERAAARSVALAQTLEEDEGSITRLNKQLALCPQPADIDALKAQAREVGNKLVLLRDDISKFNLRAQELRDTAQRAVLEYQTALARREDMQASLERARADLDRVNFNNALLKKIRAARPLIADKLWNTVLSAVSTMFSQMRGEPSVVTKDKDGFKVNGKAVTSLSGSTLDLLGLAIRVSLVKTFLPHTSFVILDEPSHGCDDNRTESMLGFIATTGFEQTIIVSHEAATEAAADHLIAL